MKDHNDRLRYHLPIEPDQHHVFGHLRTDASLRIRRQLEQEQLIGGRSRSSYFEQAVRQTPRLHDFGLHGGPCINVINSGQTQYRIAMMLNQPFATAIVFV